MIKIHKSDLQDLIITGTSDPDASFYAGELRMIQIPSRSFTLSTLGDDDRFMDFAIKTLRLAIENLVMKKVLACASEETETIFLFLFRKQETADYFTCGMQVPAQKSFGYVEKKIIEIVTKRPGCSREDLIHGLIDAMLGYEQYSNPGKEVVKRIIDANVLDKWTSYNDVVLFREKMKVIVDVVYIDEMVTALNKISLPVIQERNHNKAFRSMSERLYSELEEQLYDRVYREDRGG
ncbi:hypothetical protein KK083_03560 [Fulvivirgaceae bacterium PWU4]|uniref:Uncharacterized protein n=1 Tax=Chryseosolibacter histidini TaxID=2782349 RepID=A0AAP2DID8_9BACT|nr:hypothetical protein [Chryseosolibacter histidini]MBT1695938.1 hypothetical protein [Chryseosolibacter histidini]